MKRKFQDARFVSVCNTDMKIKKVLAPDMPIISLLLITEENKAFW